MIPLGGSRFNIENTNEGNIHSWFDYKCRASEVWSALFLLFWLPAWAAFEVIAMYSLFVTSPELKMKIFLALWLCMWTGGGIAVFFTLLDSLHPSKPTGLSFLIDGNVKLEEGTYLKRNIDSDGDEASTVV